MLGICKNFIQLTNKATNPILKKGQTFLVDFKRRSTNDQLAQKILIISHWWNVIIIPGCGPTGAITHIAGTVFFFVIFKSVISGTGCASSSVMNLEKCL